MSDDGLFRTYLSVAHYARPVVAIGIAVWVLFVADVGTISVVGVTVDGRIPILLFTAAFGTTPLWNSYHPADLLDD